LSINKEQGRESQFASFPSPCRLRRLAEKGPEAGMNEEALAGKRVVQN